MPKPDFITAQFIVSTIVILVVLHVILVGVAYGIFFERKISAWMQDRTGPNRCGFDFNLPFLSFLKGMKGYGQALADGLKFMVKEDYQPPHVDKALFSLAPGTIVIPALIGFAIIPWGGFLDVQAFTIPILNWTIDAQRVSVAGADISIGLVYILATAALGIYGVVLGGWASNNKYSMLGGLRASSQMLAYEIPMGLSILCVLLTAGSLMPSRVIEWQHQHGWLILSQPLVAVLFYICSLAECNRLPFDNAECEAELVGGYHTEYSSMRFALFFLAEYTHMITGSAIFAVLFLGGYTLVPFGMGWEIPLLDPASTGLLAVLAKCGVLFGKTALLVGFMMVVRWTLPRLRFDQVMSSAWQGAIPVAMGLVLVNSVLVYAGAVNFFTLLVGNAAVGAVVLAVQPMLKRPVSKKIPLAGSRFSPLPGTGSASNVSASAREDDPVRTAAAAIAS
ncbi:MAG: NADH-quinone oxidoreductase subunit H [Phycisphaerae bacterium]|nr:NADH-quinone oxidoreductase subunit H [Phycisphaerae bacterium]